MVEQASTKSAWRGTMQHNEPDYANVIAPPPLIYGVAFIVGWLIHRALPVLGGCPRKNH
jgi:hypothetical protein